MNDLVHGKRLESALKAAGMTKAEASRLTGISQQTLTNIAAGGDTSFGNMIKIAAVLQRSLDYFATEVDPDRPTEGNAMVKMMDIVDNIETLDRRQKSFLFANVLPSLITRLEHQLNARLVESTKFVKIDTSNV